MNKKTIATLMAPAAIGPYSQAVVVNGIMYMSGQIPIDPANGKMSDGDLREQTVQVMENIKAVLQEAGADFSKVIKSSIFLAPKEDFGTVNEVYGSYFEGDYPARETVWVNALPKNSRVEISMLVMVG